MILNFHFCLPYLYLFCQSSCPITSFFLIRLGFYFQKKSSFPFTVSYTKLNNHVGLFLTLFLSFLVSSTNSSWASVTVTLNNVYKSQRDFTLLTPNFSFLLTNPLIFEKLTFLKLNAAMLDFSNNFLFMCSVEFYSSVVSAPCWITHSCLLHHIFSNTQDHIQDHLPSSQQRLETVYSWELTWSRTMLKCETLEITATQIQSFPTTQPVAGPLNF